MRLRNPIAFTPLPVTIITSLIYSALLVALLVVHLVVPAAPRNATPVPGVNLTEAWLDLRILSEAYRPYNSRQNDHVRDWLLRRIEAILRGNSVSLSSIGCQPAALTPTSETNSSVVLFSDITSNITSSSTGKDDDPGLSVYFEGTNIIVYIRGSEDEVGDFGPHFSLFRLFLESDIVSRVNSYPRVEILT